MSDRVLPGINIQYPWSKLLLERTKVVETRRYPIPQQYVGVPLALIETPGNNRGLRAQIVGLIEFSSCFRYENKADWIADFSRHRVPADSPFAFTNGKETWGWIVKSIKPLKLPTPPPARRGIVFTKECSI